MGRPKAERMVLRPGIEFVLAWDARKSPKICEGSRMTNERYQIRALVSLAASDDRNIQARSAERALL